MKASYHAAPVIFFIILVAATFVLITYKDDKLRLNTDYVIPDDRKNDVTVDDGRIWVVDEKAEAGDVLTAVMYCRHEGEYTLEVMTDVGGRGSGIRIESDGVLMTDNIISTEIMPFTPFDAGENTLSTRFTVPGECRQVRLIVTYGGEGGLRIRRTHYESAFLYYKDAALVLFIMVAAALVFFLVFRRFGWELEFFKNGTRRLSHFGVLLICLVIGMVASIDITGKAVYRGADIQFHLERLVGLSQALSSGQFPVRIEPFWHYNSGYPVSVFYPDILLYPAAILLCLGVSEYFALCLTVYSINILTAYLGYRAYGRLLSDDCTGMAASALYTLSSYRMLTLYQGFGLGALISMTFIPVVLLGIYEILWGEEKRWPVLALGMTGVLSGHMLSATHALVLCLIAVFAGINRVFERRRLVSLVKAAGFTLLLNLWFLVPFLSMSGQDVNILSVGTDINQTMAYIPQMFQWTVNTAGRTNINGSETAGEMPLTIGIVLGLGLILYIAYRLHDKKPHIAGDLCVFLAAVSLWLSSEFFPWEYIHRIPVLGSFFIRGQFTWRYYIIATTALSVVTAMGFFRLLEKVSTGRIIMAVIFASILSVTPFLDSIPQKYEAFFKDKYQYEYDFVRHVENIDYLHGDISWNEVKALDRTAAASGAEIEEITRTGVNTEIVFSKKEGEAAVILPVFYYPYYTAETDGVRLITESGEHHRMMVRLPADATENGVLTVKFAEPVLWRLSEIVSLLTALIAVFEYKRLRNRKA